MIRYQIRGEDGLCRQYSAAVVAQNLDQLYAAATTARLNACDASVIEKLDAIVEAIDECIEAFVTTEGRS